MHVYWCYDYRIEDRNRIFFFKSNWIEIDFLAGIFSILTHGYIGEDNALLRVQSMTAEPKQRVLNTPT